MAALRTYLCILLLLGWAGLARAALPGPAEGRGQRRVGVIAFETRGVAPQLAKRLRLTVLDALNTEGLRAEDLIDSYSFLADCHFPVDCFAAALPRFNLDYVMFLKLAPPARASSTAFDKEVEIRIARMPRGLSAWGPWQVSTACHECSDSELVTATRQLVSTAWKGMSRAELPPQETEVAARDIRDKGAKLVKLASDDGRPYFERVYLLKQAIHAGAGAPAFLQLAEIFMMCNGYQEAENYASMAAAKGSKVDAIMGILLWLTGRWADALPVFQRLARANPKDEHYLRRLDELGRRTRDYRTIAVQAQESLRFNDPTKAAQLARIALLSPRPDPKARLVLAAASMKSLAPADALAQYFAVLEVEPTNPEALAGMKAAVEFMSRFEEQRGRR